MKEVNYSRMPGPGDCDPPELTAEDLSFADHRILLDIQTQLETITRADTIDHLLDRDNIEFVDQLLADLDAIRDRIVARIRETQ